jgi:hypothetical protein
MAVVLVPSEFSEELGSWLSLSPEFLSDVRLTPYNKKNDIHCMLAMNVGLLSTKPLIGTRGVAS